MTSSLEQAIRDKTANVGVIGLGYVGLPLIRAFVAAGFRTMGFDVDQQQGRSAAGRAELHRAHSLRVDRASAIEERQFAPTADMRRLAEADALLICVPTPLNESRDPDLIVRRGDGPPDRRRAAAGSARRAGEHDLSRHDARRGAADSGSSAGCKPGSDFFLAFSPEREDPGNPELLGQRHSQGRRRHRPDQRRLAEPLYGQAVVNVVPVSSCEVAEACKILENTYRVGEHRPGQRAEDALRPHGHRRLGSDRRGQDQAVRLPGVLSRARSGRGIGRWSIAQECTRIGGRVDSAITRMESISAIWATDSKRWTYKRHG